MLENLSPLRLAFCSSVSLGADARAPSDSHWFRCKHKVMFKLNKCSCVPSEWPSLPRLDCKLLPHF